LVLRTRRLHKTQLRKSYRDPYLARPLSDTGAALSGSGRDIRHGNQ
jgi:hypothetical protein